MPHIPVPMRVMRGSRYHEWWRRRESNPLPPFSKNGGDARLSWSTRIRTRGSILTRCPRESPGVPTSPPQSWRDRGKQRDRFPDASRCASGCFGEAPMPSTYWPRPCSDTTIAWSNNRPKREGSPSTTRVTPTSTTSTRRLRPVPTPSLWRASSPRTVKAASEARASSLGRFHRFPWVIITPVTGLCAEARRAVEVPSARLCFVPSVPSLRRSTGYDRSHEALR